MIIITSRNNSNNNNNNNNYNSIEFQFINVPSQQSDGQLQKQHNVQTQQWTMNRTQMKQTQQKQTKKIKEYINN